MAEPHIYKNRDIARKEIKYIQYKICTIWFLHNANKFQYITKEQHVLTKWTLSVSQESVSQYWKCVWIFFINLDSILTKPSWIINTSKKFRLQQSIFAFHTFSLNIPWEIGARLMNKINFRIYLVILALTAPKDKKNSPFSREKPTQSLLICYSSYLSFWMYSYYNLILL